MGRRGRGRQRRFSLALARVVLSFGIVVINLAGTVIVYCLAAFVVPLSETQNESALRLQNLVIAAIVVTLGVTYGVIKANLVLGSLVRWARGGAPAAGPERRMALRAPSMVAVRQGIIWMLAAVVFGVYNGMQDVRLGAQVALIVALAGWSTTAFSYLAAERALRGLARVALESGAKLPRHRSVVRRAMATWWLGTGVLLLGTAFVGVSALIDPGDTTRTNLAVTMVVFGGAGLMLGGAASFFAARASADPVRALRRALAKVERGDLAVTIPIYDATEIGHLQAGFNSMVSGLREREQMRELFGRHVGEDVARNALAGGVALGGETREVAVLFVDIIGSTTMAQERDPEEVVTLLNRFFDVVIDVVHHHDGWINKFEGDAALAVWGAPAELPDRATKVLAAARTLGERLRAEVPELQAGIGVSDGSAVAGNVGAADRYEYTVIGDPVNEAARLTDLAKEVPTLVLARGDLLAAASAEERARWVEREPVVVRGRTSPTPVASPIAADDPRPEE